MSNIATKRLNKVAAAARALEDALNEYGGNLDVRVHSGCGIYSVYVNAEITITEDGKAALSTADHNYGQIGYKSYRGITEEIN